MKLKIITAAVLGSALLVPATPAFARSYQSSAARAALNWSYHHSPRGATYAQAECYPMGYRQADCTIDFTQRYGSCRYAVTVTGSHYRIRKYDSSC
jgi:hypothetical protein